MLLDGVGSFWLPEKSLAPLREAGGQVSQFLPVMPFRRKWAANHRLHRKLYLFDGEEAIVGGHNLAFEYLGAKPSSKRWADAAFHLRGAAVNAMESVFLADWAFSTDDEKEPPPPDSSCRRGPSGPTGRGPGSTSPTRTSRRSRGCCPCTGWRTRCRRTVC